MAKGKRYCLNYGMVKKIKSVGKSALYEIGDVVEFADDNGKWCTWIVDNTTKQLNGWLKVDFVELHNDERFIPRRCTRVFRYKFTDPIF